MPYANEGRRVVVGQRIIQGAQDIFLGWGEIGNFHFYVPAARHEGRSRVRTRQDEDV
jgi:hypothetical protein